jgi:membrane-bound lytic murein transglycosylase B
MALGALASFAAWAAALPVAAAPTPTPTPAPGSKARAGRKKTRRPRASPSAPASPYAHRADVLAFADQLAEKRGLDATWVRRHLAQAQPVQAVRQLIMPGAAGTAKNWAAYRERFIEPQRVAAGLAFWKKAENELARAQAQWGVPPEMVVAIVGVETFYGRVMGRFRVIDSLATLGFDFPPGRKDRSAFFRNELEEYLAWCAREQRNPLLTMGSYAGAIGLPQFLPSSINRYAVDFDGDGRIDLIANPADVVGSIARYFSEFGWKPGLPTHYVVEPPSGAEDLAALRAPDIVPSFSAAQFAERGARLSEAGQQHQGPLALVELENGGLALSYFAGTSNFYTVTRYNWSAYYAMAVIALAEALKAAR